MVRATDTVARFGGDEFVLILEDLKTISEAEILAQKVIDVFDAPMDLIDHTLSIDLSLGISICPDHAKTPAELIDLADKAMYVAKASGHNRIHIAKA